MNIIRAALATLLIHIDKMGTAMDDTLLVYDYINKAFREHDCKNYDDDLTIGIVFLDRKALDEIKEYYTIIGYALIGEDMAHFPIDIHKNHISLFEGTYNCMSIELKKSLVKYCINTAPSVILSRFFVQWQILCDWNAFEDNGSFIELASEVMGTPKLLKRGIEYNYNLVFPSTYSELCVLVKNLSGIFKTDLYNPDYTEEANYLIYSLQNRIHINMSDEEIEEYTYMICNILVSRKIDE